MAYKEKSFGVSIITHELPYQWVSITHSALNQSRVSLNSLTLTIPVAGKKSQEGSPDSPGMVPRAIEALFKQVEDSNHAFLFTFSMLEIYMGNIKDLLVPQPRKAMDPMPPWWDAII